MANVPKRLQSDDIENLAIGMEQLSQEVQDILNGGSGFLPAAAGDIVTYDSNAAAVALLHVGSNGQVLTADSTQHKGMKWADAAAGSPLNAKGQLYGYGSAPLAIDAGSSGYFLTVDFAETSGLKWVPAPGGSPLTTRGDIFVRDYAGAARLPIGPSGYVLTVNYATDSYLSWAPITMPTTKGDILTYDANAAAVGNLARGTNGFVLKADSTQDKGLIWGYKDEYTFTRTTLVNGDTWNLTQDAAFHVGAISSGPVAGITIKLGPGSAGKRVLRGCIVGGVVAITWTSDYGTVYGAPTSSSDACPFAFVYDDDLGGWYPFQ